MDAPHFIQVGDTPVFSGAGNGDLICQCGNAFLIKGYDPRSYLGIRIKCFRCGAVTTTPGLPPGEILPQGVVAIEPRETPMVTTSDVSPGTVLADQADVAGAYALTRPRNPPTDRLTLAPAILEATAAEYDRLTGGRLAAHCAATPAAMESEQGDYPFAWSLLRLREQLRHAGWSWMEHNDDAMAAMYVAAIRHLLDCWGQHPLLDCLTAPLAAPGQFIRTVSCLATAKLLFDSGNRVGFSLPAADVQLHFSTGTGDALSLALRAPDALQWSERDRSQPQILRAVVSDALASAHGQVNARHPGIVVLAASILLPGFEQALVDSVHAVFRAAARRHRGIAAIAIVAPKVFTVERRDQMGFGYAFYPLRNPHFAGENPIRIGSREASGPRQGGAKIK